VVALSGGAVLALEILGTRILGPFYGVSLYLWSALISVTLAALSLGYFLGGAWADRGPTARRLAGLLLAAGLWVLLVPLLRDPVLAAGERLGLLAAILAAAAALFFPPLVLLGIVSPYAIRLSARELGEVGRTAGNLYAVSTVASVVAALATGFLLIPHFGVLRLTLATGLALLLAAWVAFAGSTRRATAAATLAVLGLASLAVLRLGSSSAADGGVVYRGHSGYAELCVLDRGGLRYFLIDGGVHSVVQLDRGETRHPYVVVAELACDLFEAPGEALLIGLGGGSAAKELTWRGWKVEAVEIDPVVTQVAQEHFGLEPLHARVRHADGRRFLRSSRARYDLVFLDAFGSSAIPFHLVTAEAFGLVRERLRRGGVVVVNLEARGWDHVLVRSVAATLRTHFPHVLALPIAEPPDRLGNLILLASDRALDIPDDVVGWPIDSLHDEYQHWRSLARRHAWDNRFTPRAEGAVVLTDERNPVDLWSEEINRGARQELHELFGASAATGFGWN
jgi:spermidine synthase